MKRRRRKAKAEVKTKVVEMDFTTAAAVERLRSSVMALESRVSAMDLNGTTFAHSMRDAIEKVDRLSGQLALVKRENEALRALAKPVRRR